MVRAWLAINLMDAIPLCEIIKAYTDIYVNIQQFVLYWRKYLYMLLLCFMEYEISFTYVKMAV